MTHPIPANPPFVEGQYVSCQHDSWRVPRVGPIVAVVPPAAAAGHDYTAYIVAYPPSTDEHPAVRALAIYDGMHRGLFRAEELQPVPSDDAPPATDAEFIEHVTGVLAPEGPHDLRTPGVDEWACPVEGCDFEIAAAGPVDIDEEDPFMTEIDAHRDSHLPTDVFRCRACGFTTADDEEQGAHVRTHTTDDADDPRDAVRGIVGEVPVAELIAAAGRWPKILNALDIDADRRAFAAAMRAVADLLDPEVTR